MRRGGEPRVSDPRSHRRLRRVLGGSSALSIAVLSSLASLGGAGLGHAGPTPSSGLAISLTATPVTGVAPLLVDFVANASPQSGTNLSWDFGDGHGLNGSASTASSPAHWYYTAGTFVASVTATGSTQSASANVTVRVLSSVVQVIAKANLTTGSVPLTVAFTATASGGTGTYDRFLWQFGDGGSGSGISVNYTFQRPGQFGISVNVTDSQNHSGVGRVFVKAVTAADSPANTTDAGSPILSAAGWAALAVIAIALSSVAVGIYLVRRNPWGSGSRRRKNGQPPSPADGESPARAGPTGASSPESWTTSTPSGLAPEEGTELPAFEATPTAELPFGFVGPAEDRASSEGATARANVPTRAARQLSNRVLVLLSGEGTLSPNELPGPRRTQAGIAQALGTQQNVISKVVNRLEAAGVISSQTRHVRGQSRRMKVYVLTARGEMVARELRGRSVRSTRTAETDW